MTCGIYKFTSPSNKCYIGQSTNINKRVIEHKSKSKKKHNKFYCAIRKYGIEKFKFEILEECLPNELDEKEIK